MNKYAGFPNAIVTRNHTMKSVACPNCCSMVEEDLDWICWECAWQIGITCWFCSHFNVGINVTKCSECGCPLEDFK